jgi:predicted ferric reductase
VSTHAAARPRAAVSARRRPARGAGRVALVLGTAGLVVVLLLGVDTALPRLPYPGGPAVAVGTLAALTGTYLCLALILLVARLPWLERDLGHDRLVALHRRVAPWGLVLIALHVVATVVGYAQAAGSGPWRELVAIVTTTGWMVPAAVAFVLLMLIGAASYRGVRRRVAHETWWVAHLYLYLAIALAFGHQVTSGSLFSSSPVARWVWGAAYAGVFVTVLVTRIGIPVVRSVRHDVRVAAVVPEGRELVSVHLTGRSLDELGVRGGQFALWRFGTRDWWWQAHPYSFSAIPSAHEARITVRERGDQSRALRRLRPGTRVWFEGPYGRFTADSRRTDEVMLIAGGSGAGAARALLDDLPRACRVTVLLRARTEAGLPLLAEIRDLCSDAGWVLHVLTGPREQHPLDAAALRRVAPGVVNGDVYACGPADLVAAAASAARSLGVPSDRVHHEPFAF